MPNAIKYSTTGDTLSLKKGNIYFGVGDVGKGPSSATTYYNGVTPPTSGYTIYSYNSGQTSNLSFHSAADDAALRDYTNRVSGQSFATAAQCLNWYSTQTNYVCVNRDYESIVTSGLTLCLDAGFTPSYTTSGTSWYDLSYSSNNGTLTNGPTFNSNNGGSIVFDGVDDYCSLPNTNTLSAGTGDFTFNAWIYPTSWPNNTWSPIYVTSTTNGIWIGQNSSNQFVLRAFGVADRLQFSPVPNTNTWTNVTITRIGTTATLYYNGVSMTSSTTNQNFIQGVTYIGNDVGPGASPSYYQGRISNIQFYKNIGLTSAQVLSNYNALLPRFQASFDPDAQAFITAAGITNSTQQNAVNQLVLDLKSYNIWNSMVAIYPFVGGTANINKYNLKNTSTYTLSFGGGWTHSLTGSLPNGTNAYADTGISPNSVLGSNYNYSVYSRTNTNTSGTIIGSYVIGGYTCGESSFLSNLQLYLRTFDKITVRDQPVGGYLEVSNTSSLGYYIVNRTGTLTVYKNGTSIGTTIASQSSPYVSLTLAASNVYDEDCGYGYYDSFDDKEISFATFANASLTSTNISNLNTAVQAFQTTLGRQV